MIQHAQKHAIQRWPWHRDKRLAFIEAAEANIYVTGLSGKARLVDRLTGVSERSFGAWMDEYEKRLKDREISENTRKSYAILHRLARELIDESLPIERVKTLQISDTLNKVIERGNKRTAQALRSRLKEIFRLAMAEGWVESNPVDVTDKVSVKVNRARLPWDVFVLLYKQTEVT
jgi:hypothetical protein